MAVLPVPMDGNNARLIGRGSEIVTRRFPAIADTGQELSFTVDVKSFLIHIEGATELFQFKGTHADSTYIKFTSDGSTLGSMDVVKAANAVLSTIKAPTATTINVSLIGWR